MFFLVLIYFFNIYKIKNIYLIFFLITFLYSSFYQNRLANLYNNVHEGDFIVKIISNKEETEYFNKYICRVISINKNKKYKNTKLIVYLDKSDEYEYGDILKIQGNFKYANESRNYKGYNYRKVLWQDKIYGILNKDSCIKISYQKNIDSILNKFKLRLEKNIEESIENEVYAEFLKSLILGDKTNITQDVKTIFRDASLSHILAISGMHIGYIIIMLKFILNFINSKKIKNVFSIIIVLIFIILVGKTPSSIRALVMFSMIMISEIIYRKSNTILNWFVALLIIMFINPFYIESLGVWLSFGGTLGIIGIYSKLKFKIQNKLLNFIVQNFLISICVQVCILPIIIYNFNTISLTFFISNIIISFFIGPIIFLGFFISIFGKIFFIGNFISLIEKWLLKIIFLSANFISNIKFSKIYVKTPNIIYIFFYYIILFIILNKNKFINCLKPVIIFIIIISLIFEIISISTNEFTIYFLDVGQGDCTLIKTQTNKTILIDGGEGNSSKYDEGEHTVLPYLLDRGINKIDYIMISHFDSDHCGGIFFIIKNIKVKNIIIGKQFENSDNYKDFLKIIKEKNIKLQIVEAGKKLNIEKNLHFEILWPDIENKINENVLNNNSLVCRLVYNNFSCIFTGDIEEIAEKAILDKYKNNLNILKSDVLKVAHHGSKTSSNIDFLNKMKPKIALIGVGENNNFSHPNEQVIERLQENGVRVYRTDNDGEISIVVNRKGNIIKIDKFIE